MTRRVLLALLGLGLCLGGSCPGGLPDPDGGGGGTPPEVMKSTVYAANTGGITGLAVRPSDGALFGVSQNGLFGPIQEGDDVSTLTPFGATNLNAIFGPTTSFALAITENGEFWIASPCCARLAVVPPGGGDAVAFDGLIATNINPRTLALVPAGFTGTNISPGNILAGEESAGASLGIIDVDTDTVTEIPNRPAEHLAFGPGPVLYGSRGTASPTQAGLQTIDAEGAATDVPGTLNLGARSFVVRNNDDIVILGRYDTAEGDQLNGVLLYRAADQTIHLGVSFPSSDTVDGGDLAISSDGSTIYLSLAARNEILTVSDK